MIAGKRRVVIHKSALPMLDRAASVCPIGCMTKEHIPAALIGAAAGALVAALGFTFFQGLPPTFGHVISGAVTGAMLAVMYRTY